MSSPAFNENIHAPNRLRICGLLRPVDSLEFSALRETLGIADANLSKNIKALVDLGIVTSTKSASLARNDRRQTTRIALTDLGRKTFDAHIAALKEIAEGFTASSASQP